MLDSLTCEDTDEPLEGKETWKKDWMEVPRRAPNSRPDPGRSPSEATTGKRTRTDMNETRLPL